MGWITLSLRRSQLQTSVNDLSFELLQLNQQRTRLSNFSSAIADGKVNPSEIASVGGLLFGEALDFMGNSRDAAMEAALLQTEMYAGAFADVTQEQYYNNPGITGGAQLYFDPNTGELNTEMMQQEFYEEALKDYVETYIMPKVNELEKEMEQKQTQLETELECKEQELQTVKQSVSENIQNSTIQL